jgi:hypothetical protein
MQNPARLIGAVVLASVFGGLMLTACSSNNNAPSASGTTTSARPATTTTFVPATTTTTVAAAPATTAQNLPVSDAIKSQITAVYIAHSNLPAAQVAGTGPGSVYYGYLPSTKTYWAIASFEPTANSSTQTQVQMQDDGCCGIFSMVSGGSWTFVSGYLGSPCTGQIPASLMAVWDLTSPGDCAPTTTTS